MEQVFPDQADLTAAQFPENDLTLSGGLAPYAGPWSPELAAHLLRRVTFGTQRISDRPVDGARRRQSSRRFYHPAGYRARSPVNNYNNPDFTDPEVPIEYYLGSTPSTTWMRKACGSNPGAAGGSTG